MVSNEERMEKLYELAEKSTQSPQPKRTLLGAKCPKCGGKLGKESAKTMIFSGEGSTEFARRVADKKGLASGVYNLTINHFTCKQCGYDYAKSEVAPLEDSA